MVLNSTLHPMLSYSGTLKRTEFQLVELII